MPIGSTSPTPPDPNEVVGRAQRGAEKYFRRYEAASEEQWKDYGDPSVEDIEDVIDYFGATDEAGVGKKGTASAGRDIFGEFLSVGPYSAIPYDNYGTAAEFFDARSTEYLEPMSGANQDPLNPANWNFDPSRGGAYANAPGALFGSSAETREPAPITYSPTSSINPRRPRTVAAGYDSQRRVLTVIFRDGTFYNYYGVSAGEWNNFVKSHSKGRFIRLYLDNRVRGHANMSAVPQIHRDLLYRAARTTQMAKKGYTGRQTKAGRVRAQQRYIKANPGAKRYKID